ncbi:hypothetical protein FN846DRAFT_691216 [Sphaerosporella brunnea]|uniref:Uncharacterized protein n=1 Tax=Sphaerosporella brunnea TaxID=1250544 RepID=A0A5J5EXY5_9PEZI|nr:hypothetical protein FN846DRAFT_691216 [Sphaerosporella brunnea]
MARGQLERGCWTIARGSRVHRGGCGTGGMARGMMDDGWRRWTTRTGTQLDRVHPPHRSEKRKEKALGWLAGLAGWVGWLVVVAAKRSTTQPSSSWVRGTTPGNPQKRMWWRTQPPHVRLSSSLACLLLWRSKITGHALFTQPFVPVVCSHSMALSAAARESRKCAVSRTFAVLESE